MLADAAAQQLRKVKHGMAFSRPRALHTEHAVVSHTPRHGTTIAQRHYFFDAGR